MISSPSTTHTPPTSTDAATPACTLPALPNRALNIHPHPRPPNPCAPASERFLAFESHSGFHNQGAALVNALTLAKLLNRTLLLPPARLGDAASWRADLHAASLPRQERCKTQAIAGGPLGKECTAHRQPHPDRWTYVGWDLLMEPGFLAGHDVVDRWDSSQSWLERPRSEGGLGLGPDDVHVFPDEAKHSYQLYDSRATPDHRNATWARRIDIPDLLAPPFADKKLLHFGSLFYYARLDLSDAGAQPVKDAIYASMILAEPGLVAVSDAIKRRLGTYVGVHLRMGDGIFAATADATFPVIFRNLVEDVLGLDGGEVDRLLARPGAGPDDDGGDGVRGSKPRSSVLQRQRQRRNRQLTHGDGDAAPLTRRSEYVQPYWPPPTTLPLSRSLSCRGRLHPADSPLAPLNTPVFVATDARAPATLAPFAPFFAHLPCLFTLDDFASTSPLNNNEPVAELAALASDAWVSEWDGLPLARHFFGLADAMTAAKGDAFLGTPASTFSEYAKSILHNHYVTEWLERDTSGSEGEDS